jgi:hypothetical protein
VLLALRKERSMMESSPAKEKKPHWPDDCGHGLACFIGTSMIHDGTPKICDVYCYTSYERRGKTYPTQAVCLRTGEQGEYISLFHELRDWFDERNFELMVHEADGRVRRITWHQGLLESYPGPLELLKAAVAEGRLEVKRD